MDSAHSRLRRLLTAAVVILAMTVASTVSNAGLTAWLMTFTIENGFGVAGDGVDPVIPGGPGVYKDYRLGTQLPGDRDYCVETSPTTQLLFIRLNRKLDGDTGTQYCGLFGGTPRQFFLTINSASVCNELSSHGYPTGPGSPCVVNGLDRPRIRISSDLYAKQTTTTPVAFLTEWYDSNRTSYEVRTETDASVLKDGTDASKRTVIYGGTARLWRFEPRVTARAVADAFQLPFQMTFRRTAQ